MDKQTKVAIGVALLALLGYIVLKKPAVAAKPVTPTPPAKKPIDTPILPPAPQDEITPVLDSSHLPAPNPNDVAPPMVTPPVTDIKDSVVLPEPIVPASTVEPIVVTPPFHAPIGGSTFIDDAPVDTAHPAPLPVKEIPIIQTITIDTPNDTSIDTPLLPPAPQDIIDVELFPIDTPILPPAPQDIIDVQLFPIDTPIVPPAPQQPIDVELFGKTMTESTPTPTSNEYYNNTQNPLSGINYSYNGYYYTNQTVDSGQSICVDSGTGNGGDFGNLIIIGNC